MKRQPLLADLALAARDLSPTYVSSRWREQSLDWLRMAKRFVLDEQAATYLGRMIRENPRVIADAQDFAIQPYETMWIELPAIPFYNAVTNGEHEDMEASKKDTRLGYLYRDGAVRVFAQNDEMNNFVGILPIEYRLHSPMSEEQQVALAEALHVSRVGLDLWFWGASARAFLGALCNNAEDEAHTWDREGMRSLRNNHSARLAPLLPVAKNASFEVLMKASAGDLRNMVALLLFLNRTANITLQQGLPMSEGFIKGKLRPLLSHRVITLKLDPMPRLLRLSAGMGVKRRLHDVRGHFCHDRVAREGCPHGQEHEGDFGEWWEEYDVLRWSCTGCGGKRWWRGEHKRGQAPGEVIQEYSVTK